MVALQLKKKCYFEKQRKRPISTSVNTDMPVICIGYYCSELALAWQC